MEDVLDEFDHSYPWNGNLPMNRGEPGLPIRDPGPPTQAPKQSRAGLRDMYCFWIDEHLRRVEDLGEAWYTKARAWYDKSSWAQENAGIIWLREVLNPQSSHQDAIKLESIHFPRSTNEHAEPGQKKQWDQSNYEDLWSKGPAGPF